MVKRKAGSSIASTSPANKSQRHLSSLPAETTTATKNDQVKTTSPKRAGGYPVTPDGHYFIVRSRLWRCTDPTLSPEARSDLQKELMDYRRQLTSRAKANKTEDEVKEMRAGVQQVKEKLGERGEPWWEEGEVCDRKMIGNTGYKEWWDGLSREQQERSSGKGGSDDDER